MRLTALGTERMLTLAIKVFGADTPIETITVADVQAFANHLATRPSKRRVVAADGTVSSSTKRSSQKGCGT